MGTRGLHGFHVNGKTKVTYNQFDTYPTGVGIGILEELRELQESLGDIYLERLRNRAKSIRLVKEECKNGKRNVVSKDNQERYAPLSDLRLGWGGLGDWYCLLRQAQGSILPWITGECPVSRSETLRVNGKKTRYLHLKYQIKLSRPVDHMINNVSFADGAEWGYVINLDTGMLEVYTFHGSAKPEDCPKGVLSTDRGGYGFKKVAEFPLAELPSDVDFLCEIFTGMKAGAHTITWDLSREDDCSHDRMMEVVKAAGCPMEDVIEALKEATPKGYEDNLQVTLEDPDQEKLAL